MILEADAGRFALEKRLRSPIVDGLFYPEDSSGVLSYMQSIGLERGKGGQAKAIVAPHGAWEISGSLAGAAFKAAAGRECSIYGRQKKPLRVVILGPVHDNREEGIFLTNSHSFQTPLGDIPVDQEATGWIESYSPLIKVNEIPHLQEHSIEVLLPFVKYCFPRSSIVPILVGGRKKQLTGILSNALRAIFMPEMEDTLLIASYNMVAFPGETAAAGMAALCMRLFREGNYIKLYKALQDGQITGCGGDLVAALLQSGLMDTACLNLASDSLLSTMGENNKIVYYGAFAFL